MRFFSIHYGDFFKWPRKIVKHIFSFFYPLVRRIWTFPNIATIEETINELLSSHKSIVRYGDGEMLYIVRKLDLPFQHYDDKLAQSLRKILINDDDNILIGLPDAYRSLEDFSPEVLAFWRSQITYNYPSVVKLLNLKSKYFNANITRLYYGYKDVNKSSHHFNLIRKLWDGKQVLLIEGDKSRLGLGNNLFSNAVSVQRILGPAHHAFDQIDRLYEKTIEFPSSMLVLVAMGPTAKVLTYRLAKSGYQAIDIGNLDLEYEWFQRGVKERVLIHGKYVSEVKGGRVVADVNDEQYHSQIVARFV